MVKNISVRELRAHCASVLNDVSKRFDRYVISKHGKPEAVLMCVDDYEGWLETLEIMSSKNALRDIKAAKAELKAGRALTFEKVFGRPQRKSGRLCK